MDFVRFLIYDNYDNYEVLYTWCLKGQCVCIVIHVKPFKFIM